MNLRIRLAPARGSNFPSLRRYSEFFGLNEELAQIAKPDALVRFQPHQPRRRDQHDVAAAEQSVIREQVSSDVAVRVACSTC